jgi:hypothetical protein
MFARDRRSSASTVGVLLRIGLCTTVQGCSATDENAAPDGATSGAESPVPNQIAPAREGVTIAFRSEPDPPAPAENTFAVVLIQQDRSAVTDATVELAFSIRGMPAENSTSALAHEGSGLYRGSDQLSMEGAWNVIVTISRGAERIGRSSFSVTVR